MPKIGPCNVTIRVLLCRSAGLVGVLLLGTFLIAFVTEKDDLVPNSDGRISDTIYHRMKRGFWRTHGDNAGGIRYTGDSVAYAGRPWKITCMNGWWRSIWTRDGKSLDEEIYTGHLKMEDSWSSSTLSSTAGKLSDAGLYKCVSYSGGYNGGHFLYYHSSDIVGSGDSDAGRTTEAPYHLFGEDIAGSGDSDAGRTTEAPHHLFGEDIAGSGDSDSGWTTEASSYSLFGEDRVSLEGTKAESTRADNSICKPDANGTPAWQSALESIIVKLNGIEELSSGIHALSANMTELSTQITQLIESNNVLNERFTSLDTAVIRAFQWQNTQLVEANRGYDRRLKALERRARISRRY